MENLEYLKSIKKADDIWHKDHKINFIEITDERWYEYRKVKALEIIAEELIIIKDFFNGINKSKYGESIEQMVKESLQIFLRQNTADKMESKDGAIKIYRVNPDIIRVDIKNSERRR